MSFDGDESGTLFPQCSGGLDPATARSEASAAQSINRQQDAFSGSILVCGEALMPVTALSAGIGRHTTRHGRAATIRRPADPAGDPAPALTLTVNIPLTDGALSPQAHRLIEAVRELVEISRGEAITVAPDAEEQAAAEPAGTEVQLLTASRQVLVDGEVLPLTRLEFDLLLFLADHPRRVFTRAQLLSGVWGYEHTGERTVDVHVRRLRVKLGNQVSLITTVYGVGYRLADDARIVVLPQA
jgi:DNA-binding winged helix-turn-helix (wHTH) protein